MRKNLFWLSDEQWARIAPHLPTDVRGAGSGRTCSGNSLETGGRRTLRWSILLTSKRTARHRAEKGGAETGCWPLSGPPERLTLRRRGGR
jgi:hypothetical protein